jgi:hypothetical protein
MGVWVEGLPTITFIESTIRSFSTIHSRAEPASTMM